MKTPGGRARWRVAAKAKTPFLLIQGESDATDPLGQAQEMYRALRQEGVPVELVTYPREDHGPLVPGMYGPSRAGAVARVRRAAENDRLYPEGVRRYASQTIKETILACPTSSQFYREEMRDHKPSPPVLSLRCVGSNDRIRSAMRIQILLFLAACVGTSTLSAQSTNSQAPHLEKRGVTSQLIVDGKPFLILGGELHNSSSSSLEYMKPIWGKLAGMGLNTVITPSELGTGGAARR